ncbi:nucleotidyltransferase [soil metagenome]
MEINGIQFDMDQIAALCRKYGALKLSLFGSILREPSPEGGFGFRPTSDIDMLVEFDGNHGDGMRIVRMETELSDLLRRQVDLRTRAELSPSFAPEVESLARSLHAA